VAKWLLPPSFDPYPKFTITTLVMKQHIVITITVAYNHTGYRKGAYNDIRYTKHPKGLTGLSPKLQQQINDCKTLTELHELFFSLGRKSRAVMKALIRKRKALEFDLLVTRNPISSPQKQNNYGSHATTAATAGPSYYVPGSSR
jgi:hypothetical protein